MIAHRRDRATSARRRGAAALAAVVAVLAAGLASGQRRDAGAVQGNGLSSGAIASVAVPSSLDPGGIDAWAATLAPRRSAACHRGAAADEHRSVPPVSSSGGSRRCVPLCMVLSRRSQ